MVGRRGVLLGVGGLLAVGGVVVLVWLLAAPEQMPAVEAEVPVSATDLGAQRVVSSPVVARDPTTAKLVVAAVRTDVPGPDCGLVVSGTAGRDWWPVQALEGLPEGVGACYAPQVGFDASGRLVFAFVGMAGPPPEPAGVWAVASGDHAQTFTQPAKLTAAATTVVDLAVADGGQVHLAWVEEPVERWPVGSRVVVGSGDVGELGRPVVVDDPDGLVAAPAVAAGPDGGVVVAYFRLPDGARVDGGVEGLVGAGSWQLAVARRPPGQDGFDSPVVVAEADLPPPAGYPRLVSRRGVAGPSLTVGAGGRVCVAWTARQDQALDGWVSCSADPTDAEGWARPAKLGTGLAGNTFQWLPAVDLAGGRLSAVFYHHREDAEAGQAADTFYTTADPADLAGGFDHAVRLSTRSFTPDQAPLPGWFGTRLGLVSSAGGLPAVAMWPDSRNGIPGPYPVQRLVAATVQPPARPGLPAWVAVGIAAGGLAVLAVARRRPTASRPTDRAGSHQPAAA